MNRVIGAAVVALLVVTAGCSSAVPGGTTDATTADGTDGVTETATETASGDAALDGSGTLQFYVSDERNAIGDFEHLNVTITSVALESEADGKTTYDVSNRSVDLTELQGANATLLSAFDVPNGTYTKVFANVGEVNGTLTNGDSVNVKLPSEKLHVDEEFTVGANQSVEFVFDISVVKAGNSGKYILKPVVSESGTGVEIEKVDRDDDDALEARFVGNVTPGENATVEVTRNGSAVDAKVVVNDEVLGRTGDDGRFGFAVPADAEELEVELLTEDAEAELEAEFEGSDEADEADDAEGEDGADEDDAGEGDAADERDDDENETALEARFVGDVERGGNATVEATANGSAVNATVYVDGERVGHTDEDGSLTFGVPDEDELEVTVELGDEEVELEREFE